MSILDLLFHNSRRASRARLPEDAVAYPSGFRGALVHEAELCVGCTTCRYVCSPGAIQFWDFSRDGVTWEYLSTQCTFCGKCVEYCPTNALGFEQTALPPAVSAEILSHRVEYHPCPTCGELFAPLPVPTLERLYGGTVSDATKDLMRLCEKCRKRATVKTLKASLQGELRVTGGEK